MSKKKKILIKIVVVIAVLAVTLGILAGVSAVGTSANYKLALAVDSVTSRGLNPELDELGYYSLTNEAETNFRILQLTDIHIGNGILSFNKDNKALNAVRELVEYVQPDLVIITGDMVYPVPIQAGTSNNIKETELFATFMDGFEIPWTVTFGNHDTESYSMATREEIAQIYMNSSYCLFQKGPEDIMGVGNYFINILNSDGSLNISLVLFDSNAYVEGEKHNTYDNIHEDQVAWYEQGLNGIKDYYGTDALPASMAFFHIPLNEYDDAWQLYRGGSSEVTYHYGKAGEEGEKVYAPKYRSTLFDKMVELQSTKAVFCGHDHYNDFSLTYKGIRLTYGKSIDYLAYLGISKSTWQRGGTVIEIAPDSSFSVSQVTLVDIA